MSKTYLFSQKKTMDEREKKETGIILKYNMEIIVRNIYSLMEKRKINQSELARKIYSTPYHLNYILKTHSGITVNVLGRIAVALDTTISELAKK